MIHPSLEKLLTLPDINFDPDRHIYSVGEERYTGCSTIADAWQKIFLQQWYAKECAEYAKAHYDEILLMDKKGFNTFMDRAKKEAKFKSETAKVVGTTVHDWIQKYIENCMSDGLDYPDPPEQTQAISATGAFQQWVTKQKITWLASELLVASHIHKIAGTLDGIAIVDGIPTIMDFKTSSRISEGYLLQTAGYDIMLSERGFDVRQYIILRIPKDGKDAETLTISDREEIRFLKETFLHQREAHKYYVYVENKLKEHGKMKVDSEEG